MPLVFVPYSVLSNLLGGVIGAGYVLLPSIGDGKYNPRQRPDLLMGGLLMVAVSAPIGTAGICTPG